MQNDLPMEGAEVATGLVGGACILVYLGFCLLLAIIGIVAMWKVFEKAGKPGWGALIPIYHIILTIQIAGRPTWWILLMLIPIVNVIITIIVAVDLARNFGKGVGFGLGLVFLWIIFWPILGFGSAKYQPIAH